MAKILPPEAPARSAGSGRDHRHMRGSFPWASQRLDGAGARRPYEHRARSAHRLHPLGQARALPGRHADPDRRPPARRRSRLRACGGRGICSKCQITPSYGEFAKHGVSAEPDALSPWNAVEERYRQKRGLIEGRRLGCQAQLQGDIVIDVPPESQVHKQVVRKRAEARQITMDPATRLYYVEVAEPDMHEPSGDLERLERALSDQWGARPRQGGFPHPAYSTASAAQGRMEGDLRGLPRRQPRRGAHPPRLGGLLRWHHLRPRHRCRLDHHRRTPLRSRHRRGARLDRADEPADRFGEDLMSRVSYAMLNPGGAAEMTRAVRWALNALIEQAAAEARVKPDLIFEVVIVANPVMHHLLLGIDPVEAWPGALRAGHRLGPDPLGDRAARPAAAPGRAHLHPALHRRPRRGGRRRRRALGGAEPQRRAHARGRCRHQRRDSCSATGARCWPAPPARPAPPSRARTFSSAGATARRHRARRGSTPATKEPRFRVIGCEALVERPGVRRRHRQDRHQRHLRLGRSSR